MDHELKQRLIGAVVITALAAIFIPMLFDDPVDNSGKTVTELTIPQAPADVSPEIAQNLPANKEQVLNRPDQELSVSEVEEDGHANAAGEGQATNTPDGEQTEQPGVTESLADAGSNIQGDEPDDELTLKQPGQNNDPTLDTGVVDEAKQPDDRQDDTAQMTETVKKPEQRSETPAKKLEASEKPKVKSTVSTEKTKVVSKTQKDPVKKSSSKLVRYSIQAGSFNKKENAQALVEKLRKQGIPASIVAKGDLYRVKIGPELDKKKATAMKAKLDKQNIKSLLHTE
jgi:DedD protein